MTTLVLSILSGSSSFLQIRRAIIKAWMGLNTVKIPFPNIELAPLGHLKIDRLYCDHLSAFNFDGIFFILSGNKDIHKSLDKFERTLDSLLFNLPKF